MDTLNHYESSIKPIEALASINEEYTKAKNDWNENETHSRNLNQNLLKMSSSLRDSNLAKDFWQENQFKPRGFACRRKARCRRRKI